MLLFLDILEFALELLESLDTLEHVFAGFAALEGGDLQGPETLWVVDF